jgi:hypothetical protein
VTIINPCLTNKSNGTGQTFLATQTSLTLTTMAEIGSPYIFSLDNNFPLTGNHAYVDCGLRTYSMTISASLTPYSSYLVLNSNSVTLNPTPLLTVVTLTGEIYLTVALSSYSQITNTFTYPVVINNRPCEVTWTPLEKTKVIYIGD